MTKFDVSLRPRRGVKKMRSVFTPVEFIKELSEPAMILYCESSLDFMMDDDGAYWVKVWGNKKIKRVRVGTLQDVENYIMKTVRGKRR